MNDDETMRELAERLRMTYWATFPHPAAAAWTNVARLVLADKAAHEERTRADAARAASREVMIERGRANAAEQALVTESRAVSRLAGDLCAAEVARDKAIEERDALDARLDAATPGDTAGWCEVFRDYPGASEDSVTAVLQRAALALESDAAVKAGRAAWMHEPTAEAGSASWMRAALRAAARVAWSLPVAEDVPPPCDPQWDATDGACPAWWRGVDHGAAAGVARVKRLDADMVELRKALADTARERDDARRESSALVAFRRDVAELVGRIYEGDGHDRMVASHEVILDRVRELVSADAAYDAADARWREQLRVTESRCYEARSERDHAQSVAARRGEALDRAVAERDSLAAELAAIRGSGGVLSREECAAVMRATPVNASYTDLTQAGARAQHKRDVARVREALDQIADNLEGATLVNLAVAGDRILAALTSGTAPAPKDAPAPPVMRDGPEEPDECNHCGNVMDGNTASTSEVCFDCWSVAKRAKVDLSTALGGTSREPWDALLGRVREMPDRFRDQVREAIGWVGGTTEQALGKVREIRAALSDTKIERDGLKRDLAAKEAELARLAAAQPPTIRLTAEDREALGQAMWHAVQGRGIWSALPESTCEDWRVSAVACFTLGVEAAFAAVQSKAVGHAVFDLPGGPWNMSVSDVMRAAVTAARRVVKVQAKDAPAPLTDEERDRAAQAARKESLGRRDGWDDVSQHTRDEWRRVVDTVLREANGATRTLTAADRNRMLDEALAPLPEVPAWLHKAADWQPGDRVDMPEATQAIARYLVDLVDALRARGAK